MIDVSSFANPASTYTVTLGIDAEDGGESAKPGSHLIHVTPAMALVFARAAVVMPNFAHPLSFSTLLVAMLSDEDEWLKMHFTQQGVSFGRIREHAPYDEQTLRSHKEAPNSAYYRATVSAREALAEAQHIAQLSTGSTTIDTRHLCAAYPILSGWHLQNFADFGIDRLTWARAFGDQMARRFSDEQEYWRGYADRASPVPLAPFSADVYTENDMLNINRSVEALALLIASTGTVTPLSIGVFGPWGSGKSFFMRHLQRRIVGIRGSEANRIADWKSRRASGTAKREYAPRYFGEIVQVEFNAWHYNEGNLVASLVEHLFRNLRVLPEEGDAELRKRRDSMLATLNGLTTDLANIDGTIVAAKKSVEDAKAAVVQADRQATVAKNEIEGKAREIEARLDETQTAFDQARDRLNEAFQAIQSRSGGIEMDAFVELALTPLQPLIGDARETLLSVREQAVGWREFVKRATTFRGICVIALCVISYFILKAMPKFDHGLAALVSTTIAAFAGFGNAFKMIRDARERFEKKLAELEAIEARRRREATGKLEAERRKLTEQAEADRKTLTDELAAQKKMLAKQEAAVSEAARALADHAQVHQARLAERIAAEERVREAQAEYERLSSAFLLEEFIKDRLSTDEYRKQLGFLALVRRDMERLSKLIDDANKAWLSVDGRADSPIVNRIVLYIDDLDRCKESTVLAVLEAVHLLLAFPLFVCAVAVDPRWVQKCLQDSHPMLFRKSAGAMPNRSDKTHATVADYLEKIFQIPIWMPPIDRLDRANLVVSLLDPASGAEQQSETPPQDGAGADESAPLPTPVVPFDELLRRREETRDPLRITREEATYVNQMSQLLSDRPRSLKRLVNIYRLLKASLPEIESARFTANDSDTGYRACLAQLAIFTARPWLAQRIADSLKNDANVNACPFVADWTKTLDARNDADLRSALMLVPEAQKIPLKAFRESLSKTTRYLFERIN